LPRCAHVRATGCADRLGLERQWTQPLEIYQTLGPNGAAIGVLRAFIQLGRRSRAIAKATSFSNRLRGTSGTDGYFHPAGSQVGEAASIARVRRTGAVPMCVSCKGLFVSAQHGDTNNEIREVRMPRSFGRGQYKGEKAMMDLGNALEAGLKLNEIAQHALGSMGDSFQHLSLSAIPSDCCSSNNYPTPQQ
jgi:hypothetical protein